jgi:sulfonate transport system substrate-binding protein
MTRMRTGAPRARWFILAILATFLVANCSSSASTRAGHLSDRSTTVPEPVHLGAPIPPGTVLRVGDQANYLKTYLALANEDHDFPYDVKYSSFDGGPPMLLAFRAGAVDTGFVGTTPLIFAQVQGQELRAVAAFATPRSPYSLVTAPGVDNINGWSDLRGKRVAYQRGTADQAALIRALDTAGLTPDDVTTVDVSQTQMGAALQGGSADAGVSWAPFTGGYLAANPTAKRVAPGTALTDRTALLIAASSTLSDNGKRAALADYIVRLVRSLNYLRAHPDRIVEGLYVKELRLTRSAGESLVTTTGVDRFFALPGELAKEQQRLADLYVDEGEIPEKVDVAGEFDPRFNQLIETAQTGP